MLPSHLHSIVTNIPNPVMKHHTAAVALLLILLTGLSASAQNRSIAFIEKPWADIVAQAKAEKKLIFLDGYTSWCGPCKWMAANMFTKDTIADYYNKTFVCAHFDMEKGEGVQLAQAFRISAYPTLLFVNAEGEMVHKRVGAPQTVQDYLEMGRIALTPGEGLGAMDKKYKEGDRDPQFMVKYLDRLQGAYTPVAEPLTAYFAGIPEEKLLDRGNWTLLFLYENNPDSREFIYLLQHQAEFAARYTSDSVNMKLANTYLQALVGLARSRDFTDEAYAKLQQKVRSAGFPDAGKVLFTGDLNLCQVRGNMDKFYKTAYDGLSTYYNDDPDMLNRVANFFLQTTTDTAYLTKAAAWARRSAELHRTSESCNTLAQLLYKKGSKSEAIELEKEAILLAQKEKVSPKQFEETLRKFEEESR